MKLLSITRPLPVAAIGGTLAGAARLLTADPREACARFASAEARTAIVDLGSAVAVDTVFLGYVTATDAIAVDLAWSADGVTWKTLPSLVPVTDDGSPYRHLVASLPAPVAARYWRLMLSLGLGGYAGVLALGQAFIASEGHDWGSGREIGDSSVVTRLLGGGVGVDDGVTFGAYGWTFSNLTDAELAQLYSLAKDRGLRRPLLVIEDRASAGGVHWSLFTKFEAYERLSLGRTKWGLRVEDWL